MRSKVKCLVVVMVSLIACVSFVFSFNKKSSDLVLENINALAANEPKYWVCLGEGEVACPDKSTAEWVARGLR